MTITTNSVGANSASNLTKAALATAARQAKAEAAAARAVQNLLKKSNQAAVKTTISPAGMVQANAAIAAAAPQSMTAADAISAYNRGKLNNAVAIIDTVANIQSSLKLLSTLASNNKISAVTMAGSGGLTINRAVTTGALDGANPADGTIKLLQAIQSKYTLTIDNVTAAEATSATFKGPTRSASLKLNVSDTAANLQSNLKNLSAAVTKGTIKAIAINDQKALNVEVSQLSGYAKLFSAVTGDATVNFSDLAMSDIATLGKLPTGAKLGKFSISDTSENIEDFLTKNPAVLQTYASKGQISSVEITDGKLTITSAQADANNDLLNVSFSNGTNADPVELTVTGITVSKVMSTDASISDNSTLSLLQRVSDTSANINASKFLLQTASDSGFIDHIAFDGASPALVTFDSYEQYDTQLDAVKALKGPYTLKINSLTAAQASLVEVQTSGVTLALNVKDTASNIQTHFDDLQSLAKAGSIDTIKSTEGTTKAISLTATNVREGTDALGKLSDTYAIAVTGATADEVNAWRNSLSNVSKFSVTDTGESIVRNLASLQSLAATGKLGDLRVTDGTVTMSGTQAMSALDVLKVNFINDDPNAQVQSKVALSVHSVIVNDAKTISDVFMANSTLEGSESIIDTATNFNAAGILDKLALAAANVANAPVSKAIVSDGGVINIARKADYDRLKDGLDLISSSYTLKINAISFADANAISSSQNTPDNANLSFSINDTAKNIGDNIDDLQTLAARGQIASIESSDGNKQEIVIDASKIGTSATALGKLLNSYSISIKDATVAQALTWTAGAQAITNLKSISLKDTGTNIATKFSDLQTLANGGSTKIDSIEVADGKLQISQLMALNSAALLKTEFKGGQNGKVEVTVDDVSVTNIDNVRKAIESNDTLSVKENVKDLASNLSGAVLDMLQSRVDDGIISKIDVSNIGTITVADKAAYDRNVDAIGKLRGIFTIKTENVSIAETSTVSAAVTALNSTSGVLAKAAFAVVDSSKNISDDFSGAKALKDLVSAGQLTGLRSSDGTDKSLVIDAADLGDAYESLKQMDTTGSFSLQVTNVLASKAAPVDAMVATLTNAMLKSIDVKDTGSNITRNLAALNTIAAKLGKVTVSDGLFTITEAQLNASGDFLASQFAKTDGSPVDVSITQVSASETDDNFAVIAANGTLRTISEDVEDTAQNVASNMEALTRAATAGNGTSLINKIAITDNDTLELDEAALTTAYTSSATEATAQYTDALKKISGAFQLSVKGILIADLASVATNAGQNGLRRMSYQISDTGAAITAALDDLQSYAAAGELSTVTSSDSATVTATAAQSGSALSVLKKLASGTTVDINDGAQALVNAKDDVLIAKGVSGLTVTITANDQSEPNLTVADTKTLLVDIGATAPSSGYNIEDSAVNVANQAMVNAETLVSGAAAIILTDTGTVRLTQDQFNALDALYASGNGTLAALPDYTLV